jgi:hypothetical protein
MKPLPGATGFNPPSGEHADLGGFTAIPCGTARGAITVRIGLGSPQPGRAQGATGTTSLAVAMEAAADPPRFICVKPNVHLH